MVLVFAGVAPLLLAIENAGKSELEVPESRRLPMEQSKFGTNLVTNMVVDSMSDRRKCMVEDSKGSSSLMCYRVLILFLSGKNGMVSIWGCMRSFSDDLDTWVLRRSSEKRKMHDHRYVGLNSECTSGLCVCVWKSV